MSDLESLLRRDLPVAAKEMLVPEGNVNAVLVRAARRRRHRRRVQATSLMLAAAVAAGGLAVQLRSDSERPLDVASTAGALRRGETGVVWRHGDTRNALAYVRTQTIGGTLYALSTAPGPADPFARTQPPQVLYRSRDGVDWTPIDRNGGVSFLADLSARGERLYGVGTTTASVVTTTGRDVADVAIHWTDDGASTWHRTMLGVDLAAIAAKSSSVQMGSMSIAAGEKGVVAVVGVTAQLDLTTVLPAGVGAPNGWAVGDGGIDILGAGTACPAGTTSRPGAPPGPPTTVRPVAGGAGPGQVGASPCYQADGTPALVTPQQMRGVTRSFTWADLGIGGDLLRAVLGTPMAFWSADGMSFERVDAPLRGLSSAQVTTVGDGFVIVAQQNAGGISRAVALRSADGRRWSPPTATDGRLFASSLGEVRGRAAVVGNGEDGPTVAHLDSGGWRTGALAQLIDPPVMEKESSFLIGGAVGPLGIVAVVQVREPRPREDSIAYHLLFSRDGETWSTTLLSELVDGPIASVGNVLVTENRIIVTVIPPGGAAPADHATVIIGTL